MVQRRSATQQVGLTYLVDRFVHSVEQLSFAASRHAGKCRGEAGRAVLVLGAWPAAPMGAGGGLLVTSAYPKMFGHSLFRWR